MVHAGQRLDDELYDYVIIGGGSAGCVLAARLSEDAARRVLLIEAGADVVPGAEQPDILSIHADSAFNPSYRWQVPAVDVAGGSIGGAHQARVLGGGSSLMGMLALRGLPDDYDGWAAQGVSGWGWHDVLPWFRKVEADADFDNTLHGGDGPVAIRRNPRGKWPPLARALEQYAHRRGLPHRADMNAEFDDGVFPVPLAQTRERRQSSSICYLTVAVRERANLCIVTRTSAIGLRAERRRIAAVDARHSDGAIIRYRARREVILSSGALLTPALLMRAGIGPAAMLNSLGIEVLADSPGVGQALQNHPMIFLSSFLPRSARDFDFAASLVNNCLRYSSSADILASDLYILCLNRTANHPLGAALAALQSYLLKPESRGSVVLETADPLTPPKVTFNLLSHPLDLKRATRSLTDMAQIALSPEFIALGAHFFAVQFSARLRRLNQPTPGNLLLSRLAAGIHDLLPWTRPLLEMTMPAGPRASEIAAAGRDRLEAIALDHVAASGHHTSTCRMGPSDDPLAVVDGEGRVRGVTGLRIVDASIMPTIPRGNTNLPTLMIAEKLAAKISQRD